MSIRHEGGLLAVASEDGAMQQSTPPQARRLLAAAGDPTDPRVMSGLPYHFSLYGRRAGIIDGSITRTPPAWQIRPRKLTWNAYRAATLRPYRGYQYTGGRNRMLWGSPAAGAGDVVINIFQLYPQSVLRSRARRWFFIDQTLEQLFVGYGQGAQLGDDLVRRTLRWERESYASAECVVVNSEWARASVVADYGVEPERTHVVLQAANFDPDVYEEWAAQHEPSEVSSDGPLRLVLVGNDWHRKGVDRLIEAMELVNGDQPRLTLDILGLPRDKVPSHLAAAKHVVWHGFVDKRRDQTRFLDLVGGADIGCLLSRAEAGGNCLREYHALGLAVLGTSAGGAGDQTIPEASWLVAPEEPVGAIAERLRWLLDSRDVVQDYKRVSWERRQEVLWPATLAGVQSELRARGA